MFSSFNHLPTAGIYSSSNGEVTFTSDAPLEIIKAESKKLAGVLDANKRTFAFTIAMKSFEGFNSPLQKEHFNEKYMESDKIPNATFKGKIIEEFDVNTSGTYAVRAKGSMNIHGVEKEMIIKTTILVKQEQVSITSDFKILLKDFKITIPQILNQKIAEEIAVNVKMDMAEKK